MEQVREFGWRSKRIQGIAVRVTETWGAKDQAEVRDSQAIPHLSPNTSTQELLVTEGFGVSMCEPHSCGLRSDKEQQQATGTVYLKGFVVVEAWEEESGRTGCVERKGGVTAARCLFKNLGGSGEQAWLGFYL